MTPRRSTGALAAVALLGLGAAAADEAHTGFFPHAIAVADLDGDGVPDVIVPASAERKVTVLLSDGRGGFRETRAYPAGKGPTWVTVAPLNRDRHLDFVTTDTGGHGLSVYFGDGRGGFTAGAPIKDVHGPVSVVAADFDRNGLTDLAVAQAGESRIAVFANRGGTFEATHRYPVNRGPHIAAGHDVNGDGITDVIVGTLGAHTLDVLVARGDGSFVNGGAIPVGRFPHYMAFPDWNGDGRPDLAVVVAGEDGVDLLAADGKAGFARKSRLPAGVNPHGITMADLNGDTIMDLVVANRSSGDLTIFLGTGQGYGAGRRVQIGHDIIALAAADFDRDGRSDLALVSASHHTLVLLRGDGAGGFSLMFPLPSRE
ncbi:MAG: FG-GAP repeat domain-containing protein [Candidatus Rokuibacteriota bacterium]